MPLKVQKQNRESAQSLVRRFSRKIRKSGILLGAKAKRFMKKEKSLPLKKRTALRREAKKKEYEKMKKLGKI